MSVRILAPGFFARQDTKTPVTAGVIAVAANIFFSLLLIRPLGHIGLAYATSISGFVNAGLLFWWLRKREIYNPGNGWLGYLIRIILGTVLMGFILNFFVDDPGVWLEMGAVSRLALMCQWVLLGSLVFYLSIYLMGINVWQMLRRRP